jgi:hypothetical protein
MLSITRLFEILACLYACVCELEHITARSSYVVLFSQMPASVNMLQARGLICKSHTRIQFSFRFFSVFCVALRFRLKANSDSVSAAAHPARPCQLIPLDRGSLRVEGSAMELLSSSLASTAAPAQAQARLLRPPSCCRPGPGAAGKRSVDPRLHHLLQPPYQVGL